MNIFLLILVMMAAYISIKDYKIIKRHSSFKTYATLIDPVYNDSTDNFLNVVDDYIQNEKLDEFKNKARILKLFSFIKENKDGYEEILNEIDLAGIILDNKGKIDKTKEMLNSDCFFWFLLTSIEADVHHNAAAINAISSKIDSYSNSLASELYFKMILEYLNVAKGNEESLDFFKKVVEGDYYEYKYAKDLIGIFKRLAAAILVYKGQEIGEDDEKNLEIFAKGQAGSFILKEMNLYDTYAVETLEDEK